VIPDEDRAPPRAVILAAGVGRRLGIDHPKCLLRIGGRTLLDRHLDHLERRGVDEVVLVLGHQKDRIEDALRGRTGIKTLVNPDYRQGSILSLWRARDELSAGRDIVLMDADVLCGLPLLRRLIQSPIANCFLLDRDFEPGPEPVKLCVRDGRLVEFRKEVSPALRYDYAGESVGFFRFSARAAAEIVGRTEAYLHEGRAEAPYEEAIRDLLLANPNDFGFEDITGLPWIEIDFPEDLHRAEEEVLPAFSEP
jgi:choline kinase